MAKKTLVEKAQVYVIEHDERMVNLGDEIQRLRNQKAEAIAGLMAIASLHHDDNLLWWQKKARETLTLMGIPV